MSETVSPSHAAESGPLERARILYELERYREVLDTLLPHLHDENPLFAYGLCSSSLRVLGDFAAAAKLSQQGLTHFPLEASLHMEMARALLGQSLSRAALNEAQQAVALQPNWSQTHALESAVLYEMGRHPESMAVIRRALQLDPNDPDFHFRLAQNLYRLDREEEAKAAADTGLALEPDHADLLGMQAQLEPRRGKKIDLLKAALRLNPHDPDHQYLHALHGKLLLRDASAALALLLLHLGVKYSLSPDWWAYQHFAPFAIGIAAILLLRHSREHFRLVTGFLALNLAIGVAPGNAHDAWAGLQRIDLGGFLLLLTMFSLLAYVATLIMRALRGLICLPLAAANELLRQFGQARRANVAGIFLREIAFSANTRFNLAGALPPATALLLAPSALPLQEYLLLAQALILHGAGRLWLPRAQRVTLFDAMALHCLPLLLLSVAANIPPATLPGAIFMSLALGLCGFATADFLRRTA